METRGIARPVLVAMMMAALVAWSPSARADESGGSPADWTEEQAAINGVTYYAGSYIIERNAAGTVWRAYDENDGSLTFVVVKEPDGRVWRYNVPSQYLRGEMAQAARAYGLSPRALVGELLPEEEAREFTDEWRWWTEDSAYYIETDDEGRLLRASSGGDVIFEVRRYQAPRAVRPPRNQLASADQMTAMEFVGIEGHDFFTSMHELLGAAESQPRFTSDPRGALRTALRQQGWVYRSLPQGARISMRFGTGATWTAVLDVVPADSANYSFTVGRLPAIIPSEEVTARYAAGEAIAALAGYVDGGSGRRGPTVANVDSWLRENVGGTALGPRRLKDTDGVVLTWQVDAPNARVRLAAESDGQCADASVSLRTMRTQDVSAAPGTAGVDGRCGAVSTDQDSTAASSDSLLGMIAYHVQ